jgi:hypothetical protein
MYRLAKVYTVAAIWPLGIHLHTLGIHHSVRTVAQMRHALEIRGAIGSVPWPRLPTSRTNLYSAVWDVQSGNRRSVECKEDRWTTHLLLCHHGLWFVGFYLRLMLTVMLDWIKGNKETPIHIEGLLQP